MITHAVLQNFGPVGNIDWKNLAKINLMIGGNGTGKTFLLKALYSATKTLEEYRRGNDQRSAAEILADRLYWTYQTDKIGDLVSKGAEGPLSACVTFDGKDFRFSFGQATTKVISSIENHASRPSTNSVFLPAKEVLSLHDVILKSREQDKVFGFDDTYLDLARALRTSPQRGKNFQEFAQSRQNLEEIIGGRVEYDERSAQWQFRRGNQRFKLGVTAEGIKKIAILDTLLSNRYLTRDSIIFIDEPESALHPVAIGKLLAIVEALSEGGIQFFMASHSYFVVKKLYLLAQEREISIPVISACEDGWRYDDLKHGMPDNPIIAESIRLYKEEVELAMV